MSDEIFQEGDISLTALSLPPTTETTEFEHPVTGELCTYGCERANPNSAACRYNGPEHSHLFMADIEDVNEHAAEAWLIAQHHAGNIDLDADVLIPAHHGSNNVTNPPFLDTTQPKWVLISADSSTPPTETLRNLQAYGPNGVYVTSNH